MTTTQAKTKTLRPSEDVKRRLLAGETLTTKQVALDYHVSTALLHAAMAACRKRDGWTFKKERTGAGSTSETRYSLTSPKPTVDESSWGPDPTARSLQADVVEQRRKDDRERKRRARADAKRERVAAHDSPRNGTRAVANVNGSALVKLRTTKVNGAGALGHPVPALGDGLQVYLLMLDDEGAVRVGLRNDEGSWLTSVDGFAVREQQSST